MVNEFFFLSFGCDDTTASAFLFEPQACIEAHQHSFPHSAFVLLQQINWKEKGQLRDMLRLKRKTKGNKIK